jgi:hypothetical protein
MTFEHPLRLVAIVRVDVERQLLRPASARGLSAAPPGGQGARSASFGASGIPRIEAKSPSSPPADRPLLCPPATRSPPLPCCRLFRRGPPPPGRVGQIDFPARASRKGELKASLVAEASHAQRFIMHFPSRGLSLPTRTSARHPGEGFESR